MREILIKSNSFIDLIVENQFKQNLIDFLKEKKDQENLIFTIENQKNKNIDEYILNIWEFLLADDNLADFLILLSEKNISDEDIKLITVFYSYILKITDSVEEYSEDIIQLWELFKKTITDILFNHKNEYTEFDIFEIWYPLKDNEWYYISEYKAENSIYLWEKLYIQIVSNGIIKYMDSTWEILKDLKWEYIINITNTILIEELDWWSTVINTINILWDKQIFQYIHNQDWILQIPWEEMYIQELKILKMNLETWDLIEWEDLLSIFVNKSLENDYDILLHIENNEFENLSLNKFLNSLNNQFEETEYLNEAKIYKIKRVIEVDWEVFCELDIVEKNYWEYEEWEDIEVELEDYTEQKRSLIMDIEWNIIQDIDTDSKDIDLISIYKQINILWKIFILYEDENNKFWWLIDKNWDVVKIMIPSVSQLTNIFLLEETVFRTSDLENKYYKINNENLFITHDNLITQLEKYTSFK